MLWNIKAAENLISGDFVEFITDRTVGKPKPQNYRRSVRLRLEISQKAQC